MTGILFLFPSFIPSAGIFSSHAQRAGTLKKCFLVGVLYVQAGTGPTDRYRSQSWLSRGLGHGKRINDEDELSSRLHNSLTYNGFHLSALPTTNSYEAGA